MHQPALPVHLPFLQVRVVEFGEGATFQEQLRVMGSTDVYLSVHTSNLANALFLPPGAVVVEILQRNWAWAGEAGTERQAGWMGWWMPP